MDCVQFCAEYLYIHGAPHRNFNGKYCITTFSRLKNKACELIGCDTHLRARLSQISVRLYELDLRIHLHRHTHEQRETTNHLRMNGSSAGRAITHHACVPLISAVRPYWSITCTTQALRRHQRTLWVESLLRLPHSSGLMAISLSVSGSGR